MRWPVLTKTEAETAYPIRGRDDWLFLAGDSNRVLDQLQGRLRLGLRARRRWRRLLRARAARLRALGLPLICVIAPDKEAVYADLLPDGIRPAARRPVHQVIAAAAAARIPVSYPLEQLRAGRAQRPTYYTTDSHWNSWGAFLAYREMCGLAASAGVELPVLARAEVEWVEHEEWGDLGIKLEPREAGPTVFGIPRVQRSRIAANNGIANHGRVIRFETRSPGGRDVVLVGESFSGHLLPFLKESARTLTFFHASAFDDAAIARCKPDIVIWNPTERFLIRPPSDRDAGRRLERMRLQKRRDDQVRKRDRFLAQIPHWDGGETGAAADQPPLTVQS